MQLKATCGFAGENHRSVGRKHVAFKELKFEILFGSHLFHTIDDESFGDFGCERQLRSGVVTIAASVSGDGEGGICYGVEIEACAGYTAAFVPYGVCFCAVVSANGIVIFPSYEGDTLIADVESAYFLFSKLSCSAEA